VKGSEAPAVAGVCATVDAGSRANSMESTRIRMGNIVRRNRKKRNGNWQVRIRGVRQVEGFWWRNSSCGRCREFAGLCPSGSREVWICRRHWGNRWTVRARWGGVLRVESPAGQDFFARPLGDWQRGKRPGACWARCRRVWRKDC